MKKNFSKIFISLVAIIYVFSTIGVSVISHYCGGELEKVSLFTKSTSCCGGEEDDSDLGDGCCKNETVHVSFQKDFTFYKLISDCKASVKQLFIVEELFHVVSFIKHSPDFDTRKVHPPNLVQQGMVSCSVIRI